VGNQPVENGDDKVDESALLAALKKGYENIPKNLPKVYEEEWKRGGRKVRKGESRVAIP
jgi:hypothetical protein